MLHFYFWLQKCYTFIFVCRGVELLFLVTIKRFLQTHLPNPNPCLEQPTGSIVLYMKSHKIEFMHFKQEGAIFRSLSRKSVKLVDQFTYLGSSISSTEIYPLVRRRLLLAFYRSYRSLVSDKIKRDFF